LRPEASTRSNILCLFGQGNLIFIGEKSGDFEKYCLWQPWVWFPPTSRFLLCVCSLLQTPMRCPCVPLCVNLSEPFALPQGFPSHASAVGPPLLPTFHRLLSISRLLCVADFISCTFFVFAMPFPYVPVFQVVVFPV